jgi:hypothetical protein
MHLLKRIFAGRLGWLDDKVPVIQAARVEKSLGLYFFFALRMAQRVERVAGNSLCALTSSLSFGLQLVVAKNRYPLVALKFCYVILIQYVHILNSFLYFQTAI